MKEARIDNRIAEFVIPHQWFDEYPKQLHELLQKVLIIDARPDYACNGVRYTGWSPIFNKHDPSDRTPVLGIKTEQWGVGPDQWEFVFGE